MYINELITTHNIYFSTPIHPCTICNPVYSDSLTIYISTTEQDMRSFDLPVHDRHMFMFAIFV